MEQFERELNAKIYLLKKDYEEKLRRQFTWIRVGLMVWVVGLFSLLYLNR